VILKMVTFAEKLGAVPRSSQLLQKASLKGLASPQLLESLAVARGCWHYRSPELVVPGVSSDEFSNEELAIGLLSPCLPYSPHTIRLGAAMLGAAGNDISTLVRLAVSEEAVAPVRYIANAALMYEPDNLFWQQLLDRLPHAATIPDGVMPHPSRFVSMTGMTRAGRGTVTIWIRPRADLAVAHG
jgi:hypothetical protein